MPWTVGDVDKHKKGLTPEQKKNWVKIANGARSQCLKDGGTEKTCDGKAIRIANSKFSEDSMKIPKDALQFVDSDGFARVTEENNVDIVAYSGKVIKNHWWWGDLVIDVSGGKFSKKFFPVLEQHDISRKIGFSAKPNTEDNKISLNKVTFVSTPTSEEFIRLSKEGFPYQTSVFVKPTVIEELEEGTSTDVNGFSFKGPGTIFRQWEYRECSVCVFGYDDKTHARAFSEEGEEIEVMRVCKEGQSTEEFSEINRDEEVEKIMTLEELKEKDPEGYTKLMAEAKQIQTEIFAKEKEGLETKLTELGGRLEKMEETNIQLQKENTIRAEKERAQLVKEIWANKLAASDIPERIYQKVASLVNPEKYIKDEELNVEEFSKAVDQEIADFEAAGVKITVIGSGSTSRSATEDAEQATKLEEDKKWLENMRTLAGQSIN